MNARSPWPDPADDTLESALAALAVGDDERAVRVRQAIDDFGRRIAAVAWPPAEDTAYEHMRRMADEVMSRLAVMVKRPIPSDFAAEAVGDPGRVAETAPTAETAVTIETLTAADRDRAELDALADRFLADPSVEVWLDGRPPDPARQRWEWLHLVCLALPADLAVAWRAELGRLSDGGQGLVPAAGRFDSPGLDLPCTEPCADVAAVLADDPTAVLAGESALRLLVTDVLALAASAAPLAHCLQTPQEQIRWLAEPGQREHYRKRTLTRLEQYAAATDPVDRLRRLVKVDEAVRSLFPRPLPAENSWWRGLTRRCEEVLKSAFASVDGAAYHVPGRIYPPKWRDGKPATEEAENVQMALNGSTPGTTIQWVLRVAHRAGGSELPGRVIFA